MVARVDVAVASPADFARLRKDFADLPMRPKLLRTREAGLDISSPGRQSLSLLIGEETAGALYSADVILGPGFGAPPHHQPTEEELWYLVEGELDVRVGTQSARIKAGAFAFIPRDTTHTFKNNGTSGMRLLTWNSPAGHERAFEEMGRKAKDGVTTFPQLREIFRAHEILLHADEQEVAPNDRPGGKLPPKLVLERSQGRDASHRGADVRILLEGAECGGRFEVSDVRLAGGQVVPLRHAGSETCVYCTGGAADLEMEGESQRIGAGAFAFVPRGHALRIAVPAGGAAHFLIWSTPAAPFRVKGDVEQ